jgi:hypothetical protein
VTQRASITQAALDRYALIATTRRVVVTIAMPDGTTCTIAPVEAANKADADLIKWGAK